MIRKWGLVLLMGWAGILVIVGLAALCGLEVGLAIAGDPGYGRRAAAPSIARSGHAESRQGPRLSPPGGVGLTVWSPLAGASRPRYIGSHQYAAARRT